MPSGAPQLGAYSATLPIVFAAQAGMEGLYTVEASASGYTNQPASVNVSTMDKTQNFVLVP